MNCDAEGETCLNYEQSLSYIWKSKGIVCLDKKPSLVEARESGVLF